MAYTKADKDGSLPIRRNSSASVPSFPLEKINVVQLAQDLSMMLSEPSPRTWIGKFFANNRLRIDNARLDQIAEYIERVRGVNQSVTNMQAELFLQPTVLQRLIDGDAIGAERLAELQFSEHRNAVSRHEHEITAREIQLEADQLANLRAKAEINLMEAETEFKKAMTETERARAKEIVVRNQLRVKVVSQITPRLASMPQNLLIFIIQSVFNPQAQQSAFETEVWDLLKDYKIKEASEKVEQMKAITEQQQATAEKQRHESRIIGSQADVAKMDAEDIKRKYDSHK